jgi:hypothetical protein
MYNADQGLTGPHQGLRHVRICTVQRLMHIVPHVSNALHMHTGGKTTLNVNARTGVTGFPFGSPGTEARHVTQ